MSETKTASNGAMQKSNGTAVATVKSPDIVTQVLGRVHQFQQSKELKIPKDYVPENALKSAYLILQETKDRDGKSALETCSPASIANALLNMVVQGLSPMKRQCSFIAYGGQLQMQREYAGTVALAKRFGAVKDVSANVIYENDEFEFEKVTETGRTKIVKHIQKFENIDINKIRGAYATLIFNDGTTNTEVMTITQIRSAWNQGAAKGNSPAHRNFPDQMAMKTVINRACKLHISTSDDAGVFDEEETVQDAIEVNASYQIEQNANKSEIAFTPSQEVKPNPKAEEVVNAESRKPSEVSNEELTGEKTLF